jgi:hypothetical protein
VEFPKLFENGPFKKRDLALVVAFETKEAIPDQSLARDTLGRRNLLDRVPPRGFFVVSEIVVPG